MKQLNLSKVLTAPGFSLEVCELCFLLISLSCWGRSVRPEVVFFLSQDHPLRWWKVALSSRLVHLSAYMVCCLHNKCVVAPAPEASIFCIMVTQNFSLIFAGLNHGNGDHHIKLTSTATARYIILHGRFFKTVTPVLGKMKYILSNSWWDYKLTHGSAEEVRKKC